MDIKIWIALDCLLGALGFMTIAIASPMAGIIQDPDLALYIFGIGLPMLLGAMILGAEIYWFVREYGLD